MCEKREFSSYKQVATQMHMIKHRAKGKCPKRAYYCPVCKSFHLTSSRNKSKYVFD